MATYSYLGKGSVYLAKITDDVPGPLFHVGNCSKISLGVSEEAKEQADFTNSGGGTYKKVSRIKSVEASLDLLEFSPENLSLALRGSSLDIATGTITDESHVAYKNALIPFDYLPDLDETITITNSTGDTTYILDTDYTITRNGIIILSAGAIDNESTIKVSYTKDVSFIIESLVNSSNDYRLVLNGLNEAESGKAVSLDCFRVTFSPAASLDLLGDDFGKISVKGTLLSDSSKTGTGISKYFRVMMAK